MTSSLLVVAVVVSLFAGAFLARATAALTGLRSRKTEFGKARDAVRKARTTWWRALGMAVVLGTLVILYVLAVATGDITSSEQ